MPSRAWEQTDRADRAIALGRTAEGVKLIQEVLAEYPNLVRARALYAHALRRAGDAPGARRAFREVHALDPTDTNGLLGLAWEHLEAGRWDEAEAWAAKVMSSPVLGAEARAVAGHVRRGRGDRVGAADMLLQAYEQRGRTAWLAEHCEMLGLEHRPPRSNPPPDFPVPLLQRLLLYSRIERVLTERASALEGTTGSSLLAGKACDHTLSITRDWAVETGVDRPRLYQALAARGGFCDCEVVLNGARDDDEHLGTPAVAALLLDCPQVTSRAMERRGIVEFLDATPLPGGPVPGAPHAGREDEANDAEKIPPLAATQEVSYGGRTILRVPAQRARAAVVVELLRTLEEQEPVGQAIVVAIAEKDLGREAGPVYQLATWDRHGPWQFRVGGMQLGLDGIADGQHTWLTHAMRDLTSLPSDPAHDTPN